MGQREMVHIEAACRVKCFPNGDTHSATSHQRQLKQLVETVDCFRPQVSNCGLQWFNTQRKKSREAFLLSQWGSLAPPYTEKMKSSSTPSQTGLRTAVAAATLPGRTQIFSCLSIKRNSLKRERPDPGGHNTGGEAMPTGRLGKPIQERDKYRHLSGRRFGVNSIVHASGRFTPLEKI